jgi:protein arginine N-methyltransferase 6
MFCVHAGAKKVYAVEASSMAEQARLVITANSMQDKIIVIQEKVENVTLPEQVDIIVSEWMGYMLLYESMLTSVLAARDKFLKPGGVMLPESAQLFIALFSDSECYDESVEFWDSVKERYKVDMSVLKPYSIECLTKRVHVESVDGEHVMSRPAEICNLKLNSVNSSQLEHVTNSFSMECFGDTSLHGFVTWFNVSFPDDSALSTSPYHPSTHWQQSVIYFDKPLNVKLGDNIKGNITITPNRNYQRFLNVVVSYSHNGSELRRQECVMDDCM